MFGWKRRKSSSRAPRLSAHVSTKVGLNQLIGGRFQVLKHIEGGLGDVFVVKDLRAGESRGAETFVLKTCKSNLSEAEGSAFQREALVWVRLGRHPNIVPAFWVEEIAGRVYVAAELVNADAHGRTSVRDFLASELPLAVVIRWAAQFCYGMQHSISHGLIAHRDIKPENLLIERGGSLAITDFGLSAFAARLPEAKSSAQNVWEAGVVSGTPAYMSPEQWAGQACDIRTDIYSFGYTLHELCYGRLPWKGLGASALREKHLEVSPQLAPHPLRDVIAACIQKDKAERPQTLEELLSALTGAASRAGYPIPERPQVSDSAYLEREDLRSRSHLSQAGSAIEAINAAKLLVSRWPHDAGGWTQLGRLLLERGDLKDAENATRRALAVDSSRSAPWNNLGIILRKSNRTEEAIAAYREALRVDPFNTGAMLNLSIVLQTSGRFEEAVELARQATLLAPDKYSAWLALAEAFIASGDVPNGKNAFRSALATAPRNIQSQIEERLSDLGRP